MSVDKSDRTKIVKQSSRLSSNMPYNLIMSNQTKINQIFNNLQIGASARTTKSGASVYYVPARCTVHTYAKTESGRVIEFARVSTECRTSKLEIYEMRANGIPKFVGYSSTVTDNEIKSLLDDVSTAGIGMFSPDLPY
jgi:hypothetical protein